MATIPAPRADAGEARFFFAMACIMAATNVAGFASNLAMGRSSFAMPPVVHFHAVMMMSWMALYVTQTALVAGNNLHLHRKLGKAALVVLAMVALSAVLVTINSMRTAGGPPFFDQNQFLFSNLLQLTGVVGMVCWAIALRANTGWPRHRPLAAHAAVRPLRLVDRVHCRPADLAADRCAGGQAPLWHRASCLAGGHGNVPDHPDYR
jgi:uncharacterized membrane protein